MYNTSNLTVMSAGYLIHLDFNAQQFDSIDTGNSANYYFCGQFCILQNSNYTNHDFVELTSCIASTPKCKEYH